MNTLVLKKKNRSNATLLANEFIDMYMPKANGEFVKVYLYLLRHMDNPDSSISIPAIADSLNHTETDIIRGIKYWESEGLLSLDKDSDDIVALELFKTPSVQSSSPKNKSESIIPPNKKSLSKNIIPFNPPKKSEEELKTVLHITELYLGKPISSTEAESIIYLYEDLNMSFDLIEYLVGTCVDNGNKSIPYISKVAFDWHEKGITTIEQAKEESKKYNSIYNTIINTFGIINRGLAKQEIAYVDKWTKQYGFSTEIIEEACDRTIAHTSQPNFKYADSILKGWYKNNVSTLNDIHELDKQYLETTVEKKAVNARASGRFVSKTFSKNKENYEKSDFDYDTLVNEQIKARLAERS